ncbi:CapA family protein [Piscibacillus halophilus]|uniref:Poly-gamma-glutamate synthesis protein (Capsule biosynthesis protein) n=1 Tax=Piscibacillus halophilus TaxID=571933 RepID=A0A1H9IHJ1_9BACI|nr:CapA family protein [Piscibacillus halophilus]SEQ74044.1 poly-gamma-glutamate synthesis protein (capsule biosynthesis protein) [Piscibacillus halophilus]
MRKKIITGSIIFLMTLGIVLYINLSDHNELSAVQVANNPAITVDHYTENKYFETSITLNAIGDLLIHSTVYNDARTGAGFDFNPMFKDIKYYLRNADITIANQETVLGGAKIGLSTYPQFNSPQQLGDTLKESGVDIVSMANNHTLDRGEEAVISATNYLQNIGVEYVGAYQSEEDKNTQRIIHRKGIAVGFLSYTYGTNGIPVPEGKEHLVNLIDEEQILNDLEELKPNTDFIVVSMHFGEEYQPLPNDEQVHLSELLTNNGADVIIGHHPHVLQPVDWIATDEGEDKFVAYSLGNFLSGQTGTDRLIGAIMQIELTKTIQGNNEKQYKVSNAKMMPTYNQYENFRNYKIVPLVEANEYSLSNAQQWFEDKKELIQTYTDNIEVVPYLE